MLNLKDLTWNVYEICRAHNKDAEHKIDLGVAYDMLRTNIEYGNDNYPGAVGLDFVALKAEWDAMTEEEHTLSRAEYHAAKHGLNIPLSDAFKANDRAEFDRLLNENLKDYRAKKAEDNAEAED